MIVQENLELEMLRRTRRTLLIDAGASLELTDLLRKKY